MDKERKQQIFAIALKGEVEVRGKVIKHLEGGFGENCRIISAKDIALEHGVELKHINELINRNLNDLKIISEIPNSIEAPVKKGDKIGTVKLLIDKGVLLQYKKEVI